MGMGLFLTSNNTIMLRNTWHTTHFSTSSLSVKRLWSGTSGKRGPSILLVVTKSLGLTSKSSCFADFYSSPLSRRGGCVDFDPRACEQWQSHCAWNERQFVGGQASYKFFHSQCCRTCRIYNSREHEEVITEFFWGRRSKYKHKIVS